MRRALILFTLCLCVACTICAEDDYYKRMTRSSIFYSSNMPNDEDKRVFNVKEGDISYEIRYGLAYIKDMDSKNNEIIIPLSITYKNEEFPVRGVVLNRTGSKRNETAYANRRIYSLKFAEGFTSTIPHVASDMVYLKKVEIPQTVSLIMPGTFSGCSNLEECNLPEIVTIIGNAAFSGCSSLKNITIPSHVTGMGFSAFSGVGVEELVIPENVKILEVMAFSHCKSLKKVVFLNELDTLKKDMFYSCEALESIVLPNTIRHMEAGVFSDCYALSNIVLPDRATYTRRGEGDKKWQILNTFFDCNKLTNIRCHNGTEPKDILEYIPANCPYAINGGKSEEPAVLDQLLADNHPSEKSAKPILVSSDVDAAIPDNRLLFSSTETYAVIVGNEKYNDMSAVPYAERDASVFRNYCLQTLTIPEKNIMFCQNATFGELLKAMKFVNEVAQSRKGAVNVLIYFSGHGTKDDTTGESYLIPVDADSTMTELCYPLSKLYALLTDNAVRQTIMIIDADFGVTPQVPLGNTLLLCAASGVETAQDYQDESHGMLTYFLLKKLQESKGECTLGDMSSYVIQNVEQQSMAINSKKQTPTVIPSKTFHDIWRTMKLK